MYNHPLQPPILTNSTVCHQVKEWYDQNGCKNVVPRLLQIYPTCACGLSYKAIVYKHLLFHEKALTYCGMK